MRPLRGSASPGRLRLLIALLPLVAGCAARQVGPPAPSWTGAPASIPRGDRGAYFAPQTALQFLVDPYPEPEGPSWLGADVATSIRATSRTSTPLRLRNVWIASTTGCMCRQHAWSLT